ncbi:hypothetical protein BU198_33550, partial [Streptomyces sp. CBMA156]|nr:hypothetical protein [Streptomyces sp. CBMA156]
SGAPQTQSGTPEAAPPAEAVTERLERVGPAGPDGERQEAERKKVEGRNPGDRVAAPHVADDAGNQVSAQEVQQVQGAVDGVPSTDPALNTTVGRAPTVELTGESDPARTDRQAAKLKDGSARILGVGREDAAKPMGEDRIYPDVPKETLTASVPGGSRRRGGTGAGRAAATKPGIGIVTRQERGPQIQAAVGQGQGRLASEQATRKQGEADARRQNQAEVDQAVADNAQAQAGERGGAAEKVTAEREQWRTEQDQQISGADHDADAEHKDKTGAIDRKRTEADKDVQDRQQQDNQKIQDKRKEAEEKARKEKDRKKEESEGWWGWVKSKVKAAFDALVEAVTKVFDYFRGLINDIIDGFRKFADWAIDQARKFAVELIDKLADALIRICDVLLAAFPELRDRFRRKIDEWRDKAVAKVNEWADRLKNAVNKLLDALAAGLNALLDALEAGLKAAIEAVRTAVMDAIDFVQKAIAVFGEFAALIGDIAPDPGGWLKKLGTAAVDGIQHYLWGAVKSAVRTWFDEKVESVVGLTSTLVNVLVKGCISMAQIGRMAWQAIVAALPGMIVSIVVEKLVSMIVPAAGAIMAIIQGLMAAWNTISKIIAAIGKFVAFLKAVKSGSAACLFADAVAAGVVALLDFISNFLLSKLKGAGKAVGTKLKGIAQKILKGLARAGRGTRKAAGRAVNKARASLRRAGQSLRRRPSPARTGPARHTVRRAEHHTERPKATAPGRPRRQVTHPKSTRPRRPTSAVGRALNSSRQTVKAALTRVRVAARTLGRKLLNSKLGRALTNGAHRIRDAYRKQRDRLRAWHQKRQQQRAQRRAHENSRAAKEQRLSLIVAKITPKLQGLLHRGASDITIRAVLTAMRAWYRLSGLEWLGERSIRFRAWLNPDIVFLHGAAFPIDDLLAFVRKVGAEVVRAPQWARTAGVSQDPIPDPTSVPTSAGRGYEVHELGDRSGAEVQEYLRGRPGTTMWQVDIQRYRDQSGAALDVDWQQWWGRVTRNRGVLFSIPYRSEEKQPWRDERKRTPSRKDSLGLSYKEIANLFDSWQGRHGALKQQVIAQQAVGMLGGRMPDGPNRRFTAELTSLMIQQEGLRNVGTMATGAMLLDMAARGHVTLADAARLHPMAPKDSQAGARELRASIFQGADRTPLAERLRDREVDVVEAWVRSLGKEIVVDSYATGQEKRKQLMQQIRDRIHRMYNIDPRYTALRNGMD